MKSLIFFYNLISLFCIFNLSLISSNSVPGHVNLFFKQIGNNLHVVPRHMLEDDHDEEKEDQEMKAKESHHQTKRSTQDDQMSEGMNKGMNKGIEHGQKSSDLLASIITSTFNSIPSDQKQDDQDDDEGKVENHVPGYKGNSITTPIGEAVVDEWAKLIGDCDHNSSIDPTATSSCQQKKTSVNGDNEP
ncbi:secreted protein [Melampsora americana]|nr:secreted protein [Melampsora americana]